MDRQALLSDLVQIVSGHERALVAGLSQEERDRTGRLEGWSAKDVIAHCAEWRERLAGKLAAIGRGETPPEDGDFDHANAEIYQRFQHEPWDVVLAKSQGSTQAVLDWVGQWGKLLDKTGFFPQQPERAVWREIAGTGYIHPVLHLVGHAQERGDADFVARLNLEMAAELAGLDEGAEWQGMLQYNLACFYSLSGDAPQAYAALRPALQLRPDLAEYATRDTDFAGLWDDKEFLQIISEARTAG